MADKSTELMIAALSRAVSDADGSPLFAAKSEPGLFPATAVARPVAQRCLQEGYLRVVRTESVGRSEREIVALTDKGLLYLAREASPRHVLEDFVRALEVRSEQARQLQSAAERMGRDVAALRLAAEQILPRLRDENPLPVNGHTRMNGCLTAPAPNGVTHAAPPPSRHAAELGPLVLARLSDWHLGSGASQDCPLPELYRRAAEFRATVGEFHDTLRQLHENGQIYLHPWTGPLYDLPEPTFALLVGHEIAYYASIRL